MLIQETRGMGRPAGRGGFRAGLAALALVGGVGMLSGCAPVPHHPPMQQQPVQPPPPPPVQSHPLEEPQLQEHSIPAPAPQTKPPAPASSPAVLALVTRAEHQQRAGDLGGSEATLERAVQIEPHNARLWLDFAHLRLAQNQPAQAEQFALRAVRYAQADKMLHDAWLAVAAARSAQGNKQGADEARRKAGGSQSSQQGAGSGQ